MASKGVKAFREAGLTKVTADGKEQFYIHNNEPDPQGRHVYCVVAKDMTFNELVPLTSKELMWVKLKHGDFLTLEDWTETFNIQPKDLELLKNKPLYGVYRADESSFKTLMQLCTGECIKE